MTEIRLKRAILRPWRVGDEASLTRHANNPNVSRNLHDGFPSPYTEDDARSWVASHVGVHPLTVFAIEVDGEAAGGIGITFPLGDRMFRGTAELGYWLSETFWGRGIIPKR